MCRPGSLCFPGGFYEVNVIIPLRILGLLSLLNSLFPLA